MARDAVETYEFAGSRFRTIYLRELYWLCHNIDKNAAALFSMFPVVAPEVYISTKLEGLDLVYSLLSSAAKVQELTTWSQASSREKLHKERAEQLTIVLKGLGLSALLNKKVRNTVEHFAEYLDYANKTHTLLNGSERYFVAFDLIISHLEPVESNGLPFQLYSTPQLEMPLYPVRVYVSSQRAFYNLNWSINLDTLANEAASVQKHLVDAGYLKAYEGDEYFPCLIAC